MLIEVTYEGEKIFLGEHNVQFVIRRDWVLIDQKYGGEVTWISRNRVERPTFC